MTSPSMEFIQFLPLVIGLLSLLLRKSASFQFQVHVNMINSLWFFLFKIRSHINARYLLTRWKDILECWTCSFLGAIKNPFDANKFWFRWLKTSKIQCAITIFKCLIIDAFSIPISYSKICKDAHYVAYDTRSVTSEKLCFEFMNYVTHLQESYQVSIW